MNNLSIYKNKIFKFRKNDIFIRELASLFTLEELILKGFTLNDLYYNFDTYELKKYFTRADFIKSEHDKIEYNLIYDRLYIMEYDKETGILIKTTDYKRGNKIIYAIAEYDRGNGNLTKYTSYGEDKFIIYEYDKEVENEIGTLTGGYIKKTTHYNDSKLNRLLRETYYETDGTISNKNTSFMKIIKLRKENVSIKVLNELFTLTELRNAGISLKELVKELDNKYYDLERELKKAGFSAKEMKEYGKWDLIELIRAGFSVKELIDVGFDKEKTETISKDLQDITLWFCHLWFLGFTKKIKSDFY